MDDVFTFYRKYNVALPTSVVQVGASVGQELDLFSKNGVKRGVFIEALREPYEHLLKNLAAHPVIKSVAVNCCIACFDGKREVMSIASNFGQSSSILQPTRHLEVYPSVRFEDKLEVTAVSLDTVMARVCAQDDDMSEPFDLIYLDVQGAELDVLKGATKTLFNATTVYTEVTFGTDYLGAVNYSELACFLELHGFKLCSLEIDPSCRAHGNALFRKIRF